MQTLHSFSSLFASFVPCSEHQQQTQHVKHTNTNLSLNCERVRCKIYKMLEKMSLRICRQRLPILQHFSHCLWMVLVKRKNLTNLFISPIIRYHRFLASSDRAMSTLHTAISTMVLKQYRMFLNLRKQKTSTF